MGCNCSKKKMTSMTSVQAAMAAAGKSDLKGTKTSDAPPLPNQVVRTK